MDLSIRIVNDKSSTK